MTSPQKHLALQWALYEDDIRVVKLRLVVGVEKHERRRTTSLQYREEWTLLDEPSSPLNRPSEAPIRRDAALALLHNALGPIEEVGRQPCGQHELDDLLDANTQFVDEPDPLVLDANINEERRG